MKTLIGIITLGIVVSFSPTAESQVQAGISIGEEGVKGFYLAIGTYFRQPETQIIIVKKRGIAEEELPVLFFIAGRANVEPGVIADLRLRGMSWIEITLHYGLSPEIFYVPVAVKVKKGPYGRAYGYYEKKPRKEWKSIVLDDDDIINKRKLCVDTRFFLRIDNLSQAYFYRGLSWINDIKCTFCTDQYQADNCCQNNGRKKF